jgi:hypothetical protein
MARLLPIYLDAVVSIEVEGPQDKQPIATGFLFGRRSGEKDPSGQDLYGVFLVTNRHVFEDPVSKKHLPKVFLRFNVSGGQPARHYEVNLLDPSGKPIWIRHAADSADIAVLSINGQKLREEGIKFFFFSEDRHSYLMADREKYGIATGDGLFVLGFPMGIRGAAQNFVIARKGIVARVDEEVLKEHFFFVDVAAYPGNSGGPIVIEVEIVAVGGTKAVSETRLIGVVSKGITYQDVAVSRQSGQPRVVFEEQTGLVKAVPIDSVVEAIDAYMKTQTPQPPEKEVEAPTPNTTKVQAQ